MRSILLLVIAAATTYSCKKEEPWQPCFYESSYAVEDSQYSLHMQGWDGPLCNGISSKFDLEFISDSMYTFEHVLYTLDCDSITHIEQGKVSYEWCETKGARGITAHTGNMTFIPSNLLRGAYSFRFQRDSNWGLKLDDFPVYNYGPTRLIF